MLKAATVHVNSNQGRVLFKGEIHSRKYGKCTYEETKLLD